MYLHWFIFCVKLKEGVCKKIKRGVKGLKLRTRLIISFLALTIIPISIIIATFGMFTYIQKQEIQHYYGIELEGYESLSNSSRILTKLTSDVYETLVNAAQNDVGSFAYEPFLNSTNAELKKQSSYLIVRRDDKILYNGSKRDNVYLTYILPAFGDNFTQKDGSQYLASENVLVKAVDFYFEDGANGSAFIITDVDQMIPQLQKLYIRMVVAIVIIILLTAAIFVIWTYRSLVSPINDLQKAVHNIQEGNLEFKIEDVKGSKEFVMLSRDFENMREQLKTSQEEKQKYDEESRELIGNISHDLKTPMTSIKGYIEGIRDGVADTPEKMERYMTTIYNKAMEMDRLVTELNIYSRIETNQIPYNFIKMNISDYFDDCVEDLAIDMKEKNIDLNYFDHTSGNLIVKADPEQIARVVNNIVGNSAKYMDKDYGTINIHLKKQKDEVVVIIEDNGQGIAKKDLPMVFERFYRADASRNSKQGGSGIGLSIVKKIITDHGGKIWVESEEKKGTTMYFSLKCCKEDEKTDE